MKPIYSIVILMIAFNCLSFELMAQTNQAKENPQIRIFEKGGDTIQISSTQLKYWKSIQMNIPDLVKITRFKLKCEVNHVPFEFESKSHKLTPEMLDFFNKPVKLKFINIQTFIIMPDKTNRYLSNVLEIR